MKTALTTAKARTFWLPVALPVSGLTLGLSLAGLLALTGCVGYVDGGYDGGGAVVVGAPDVYLFGGGYYDHGRDVHGYSHRGAVSRGGGGGHDGGHGGGHGGKR